jgi:hypothetical protein
VEKKYERTGSSFQVLEGNSVRDDLCKGSIDPPRTSAIARVNLFRILAHHETSLSPQPTGRQDVSGLTG